jgi:NSS family neurotransmitter:Na+ symporter
VLVALGQAFFTLSLGMGAIMAYGAYLPEDTSIGGTAFTVVLADTGIAMLAGLVIFPIVFANGLDTAQGPGLVFVTLPLAFGGMPGGLIFGTLFFLLLTFAAWTSAIGLIEPAVAWLVERLGITRALAAIIVGLVIWVLGCGSVLSFNVLADVRFGAGTFFDNADYVTSNLMLPLGGLLITLFAAYVVSRKVSAEELALPPALYTAWRMLARYIVPLAVVAVMLFALGLFG